MFKTVSFLRIVSLPLSLSFSSQHNQQKMRNNERVFITDGEDFSIWFPPKREESAVRASGRENFLNDN